MDRFISFLERRGTILLACTAVVMAAALVFIIRLDIDTEFDVFMPPDSVYAGAIERMNASFGDGEQLVLLADIGPAEERLSALVDAAREVTSLDAVVSARLPLPESLLAMAPSEREQAVAEFQQLVGGQTIVEYQGTKYGLVRVLLERGAGTWSAIRAIETTFSAYDVPIVVSGEGYLKSKVFDYVTQMLITIPPVVIALMLLVFFLRIGNFRATVLSMIPALVSGIITLGGIAWFTGGISIVSVLVPIFVIVLGSAAGLHITSHVMDELAAGCTKREAVAQTLRTVGGPVVLATLTTMAGFLSQTLINSKSIRELGVSTAIGILIAGATTLTILPAVLLRQKPLRRQRTWKRGLVVRVLGRFRGWPSIVFAVVLVAVFAPGIVSMRANFSMIDIYRPYTEVRRSIDLMSAVLGGSIPVYVTYEDPDQVDARMAAAVLEVQDRAQAEGVSGTTLSMYSLVRAMWQSAGNEGYPTNRAVARTLATRLRFTSREFVDSFVAPAGAGRAVFFLRDLDDATLERFLAIVEQTATARNVQLDAVSTVFVVKELNDQIIVQQLWSLAVAVGVVFLLTVLTQRDLRLGLAATSPILLTLVVLFGVMGYARIDLSVMTGVMSGLTIGVGIDYAIHYVSLLRQARKRRDDDPSGSALRFVATPVLANALGLSVGFTALLLSPLQIHVTLTILMWATMMTAALLSLTFLPTITARMLKKKELKENGAETSNGT